MQRLPKPLRDLGFLLNSGPAVIYVAEPQGEYGAIFITANVEAQLGYKPDEFVSQPQHWLRNVHPEDVPKILADIANLFECGKHKHVYRFRHKNGAYRWMRDEMTLIRDQQGQPSVIVGYWIDITEEKHLEEELQEARRKAEKANLAKSRFLAAASHDLRQPLQTIALLQGILKARVTDERTLAVINKIGQTLTTMSGMLNTLLDVNQLEAGIVKPAVVDFPIGDLLRRLATEFANHVEARGLGFRVVPSNLMVRSDPKLLEEVVRNLLSNAVKYTPKGKVLVGCRRRGDTARIEVWDTGIGIPKEQLQQIFEEYHQVDNPARDRERGLGLGLSIVQSLAKLLEHPVDVRSLLNKGSVFSVAIPLGQQIKPKPATTPFQAHLQRAKPFTILLVEDDTAVRDSLQILLEIEGHHIIAATEATSAFAALRQDQPLPDVILTDFNLPGGVSGLELIELVRKECGMRIPAIILTGEVSADKLRQITAAGCVLLNKPTDSERITTVIADIMRNQPARSAAGPIRRAISATTPGEDKVYFVDDDPEIRELADHYFDTMNWPISTFPNAEAFLAACADAPNGCLVADISLPGMSGIELLEEVKSRGWRLPVILLTGRGDIATAVAAMKSGAADFLEKPIKGAKLLARIQDCLRRAKDPATRSPEHGNAATRIAALTAHERQVMDLVIKGRSSKMIALEQGLSQRTVEHRRRSMMKKLGVTTLPDLIRFAVAAR